MKIYVVGNSKDLFLKLDNIREKFLVDQPHEGDNIDFLNPWYCELTGLYYLWKHVEDEIVGLEHYRTYFWNNNNLLDDYQIIKKLKTADIICGGWLQPHPIYKGKTNREEFKKTISNEYDLFITYLKSYNFEFFKIFNKYLDSNKFICCNMFITTKNELNNYMEFFFDLILNYVAKNIPNNMNLRREGWLSEFLFGAYLLYKNKNIILNDIYKFNKELTQIEYKALGFNL